MVPTPFEDVNNVFARSFDFNKIKRGDTANITMPVYIYDLLNFGLNDDSVKGVISGDSVEDGNVFMFGLYRNIDLYIKSMKHLADYDGQYDDVYAMHGSIPVKPDIVGKLIEGADQIRRGEAKGTAINLFGNDVILYKYPYAGFLCDSK